MVLLKKRKTLGRSPASGKWAVVDSMLPRRKMEQKEEDKKRADERLAKLQAERNAILQKEENAEFGRSVHAGFSLMRQGLDEKRIKERLAARPFFRNKDGTVNEARLQKAMDGIKGHHSTVAFGALYEDVRKMLPVKLSKEQAKALGVRPEVSEEQAKAHGIRQGVSANISRECIGFATMELERDPNPERVMRHLEEEYKLTNTESQFIITEAEKILSGRRKGKEEQKKETEEQKVEQKK